MIAARLNVIKVSITPNILFLSMYAGRLIYRQKITKNVILKQNAATMHFEKGVKPVSSRLRLTFL